MVSGTEAAAAEILGRSQGVFEKRTEEKKQRVTRMVKL